MITVVIATKNGSAYITRALDSIFSQTVCIPNHPAYDPNFKVRVVSDGSTDQTEYIVAEYSKKEPRVELISLKKNIGPGLARNLAIFGGKTDTGECIQETFSNYIAFIDDDDIWTDTHKLENQVTLLSSDNNLGIVGSSEVDFVSEDGDALKTLHLPTSTEDIHKNMLSYNPLITSSVLCKTEVFKKAGGFAPLYLAEDYDLWLRIGQISHITNTPGAKIAYTVRKNSASHARKKDMAYTVLGLVKSYKNIYPNYTKAIIKAYARVCISYILR